MVQEYGQCAICGTVDDGLALTVLIGIGLRLTPVRAEQAWRWWHVAPGNDAATCAPVGLGLHGLPDRRWHSLGPK